MMKKNSNSSNKKSIKIYGAKEHNLKNIHLSIPRDKLLVITGVSGSGKSSLAFDTIFAEGQRKYMESLSSYARQFLKQMHKPNIESIEGLPPTIAIEQRSASHNPRSTVATTTEIYDYLRLLFSRCGLPRCWHSNKENHHTCSTPITKQSASQIVSTVTSFKTDSNLVILSPIIEGKKGYHREVFERLQREGFTRLRLNGETVHLDDKISLNEENPFNLSRYKQHTIEAIISRTRVMQKNRDRIADSIETALKISEGNVSIMLQKDLSSPWEKFLFSEQFSCPKHPDCSLQELEPRLFSFNSPFGACKTCSGLGTKQEFNLKCILNENLSLAKGAFIALSKVGYFYQKYYRRILFKICRSQNIDSHLPFKSLSQKQKDLLLYGSESVTTNKKSSFRGILYFLKQRLIETENENVRKSLNQLLSYTLCPSCKGGRLRKEAFHIFLKSKQIAESNIIDIAKMTVHDAKIFFQNIELNKEQRIVAKPILKEVLSRLDFLCSVGLGYLNLNRKTSTLSGGEAQRIRLASQIGTGLVGVCYVLDEPTIGLHQRDNLRLINTLRHLVDIGNTVIVVEHDEEMIRSADCIIDIGPGPGIHGGHIIAQGTSKEIEKENTSITGNFLSGKEQITPPQKTRELSLSRKLRIEGATQNNLKNINIDFPLGGLICVTGVSGSGKSTLVNEILLKGLLSHIHKNPEQAGNHKALLGLENIKRVVAVDQTPIGKTPRSNPATYTNLFDEIRSLFAKTPQAISRGYPPGRFSFNVKGGRCEDCQGQGVKKIEMHFLADIYVPCETCNGKRYNYETLEIFYKKKNISDVLKMTVEEALSFFESHPKISRILRSLHQVGLDYIQIGQASTTLSGGEAQRVKLATELARYCRTRSDQHTVYILDEPTTGLHFADIKRIISVFHSLAEMNNTLIVIEHNLDVIKCADWIIDLGPEGGEDGGELLSCGPPEKIVKSKKSFTGKYLSPLICNK